MFCNYCGNPNPDDAAFCAKCGKPIAHPAATSSQPSPTPAPAPSATVAPPVTAAPAQPAIVAPAPVATPPVVVAAPPVVVAPKKKRRSHWFLILLTLFVLFVLLYPHKDGNTICSATQQEVVEQVPYAVDILAVRHPIAVGLLRSTFNQNGAVDKVAEDYIRSSMQSHDPSALACYTTYYAILFNQDRFRTAIADSLEQQLNALEQQLGLNQ